MKTVWLFAVVLPALATAVTLREKRATNTGDMKDLYTKWYKGEGTYYGAGGHVGGTCQLSHPTPTVGNNAIIKHYVAMNGDQWFDSFSCGMCFRAKGQGQGLGNSPITGDFYVYVKDKCSECKAGDLDLAANGDGRWHIEIQAVQCPVDSTNAKIQYKFQGTNPWYVKVQTRNERVPITSFKLWKEKQSAWGDLKRTADGFWELGPGHWDKPIPTPLKVKLHSAINGQTIEDSIPRMDNDEDIDGEGTQFARDPNLPSADDGNGGGGPGSTAAPTAGPTEEDCEL